MRRRVEELSRRDLLAAGGGLIGGSLLARVWPAASALAAEGADPLSGAGLYRDVVHYAGMGGHRTGTTVDMATSEWMRGILDEAGFPPSSSRSRPSGCSS